MRFFVKCALFMVVMLSILLFIVEPNTNEHTLVIVSLCINVFIFLLGMILIKRGR